MTVDPTNNSTTDGNRMHGELQQYWDGFYSDGKSSDVPAAPSAFAEWTLRRLGDIRSVIEFGFGNARDSLWFATQGKAVLGFDFADSAVATAQGTAVEQGFDASFERLDLYDGDAVKERAKWCARSEGTYAIYGRFLLHSLKESGRHNLFDFAAVVLRDGGTLFLEFRTRRDSVTDHVFGENHFRTYLDPDDVVFELEDRGGQIVERLEDYGMAIYKSEDPHVCRLSVRW